MTRPPNGPAPTRVAVIRHGPFFSDPRVAKEALALAEQPGVTVEAFVRGPDVAPWASHPRLTVRALDDARPADRPVRLAVQAVRFGLRVRRLLARSRPRFDVVIVHSIPSWLALMLFPAGGRPRPRLILDHHEPEVEMVREAGLPPPMTMVTRAVESLSIRAADGVVDVSPEMATRSAELGARRQFVVDNAPAILVPSATGAPRPSLDLAVFGSLIERYDLPTLRESLALMGEPVDVRQIGRGPAWLPDNPSGGRLVWTEFLPLPELQATLRDCRFGFVGLNPSAFTDLVSPNRLFELAGLEIPAVVARTTITTRLLGPFALYYQGGSSRSLRDALRTALRMSEGDRRRMGDGARRRLAGRSWEAQYDGFVEFCLDRPVTNGGAGSAWSA